MISLKERPAPPGSLKYAIVAVTFFNYTAFHAARLGYVAIKVRRCRLTSA